jgi:hypothetical protein
MMPARRSPCLLAWQDAAEYAFESGYKDLGRRLTRRALVQLSVRALAAELDDQSATARAVATSGDCSGVWNDTAIAAFMMARAPTICEVGPC